MKKAQITVLLQTMLVAGLLFCAGGATAGDQAERAIAGVLRLEAEGKIRKDTTLRLALKKNIIHCFWGKDYALKTLWENRTGVWLEASLRPNLPVLEDLRTSEAFDVAVARQREFGDLFTEKCILPLTPYVKRYALSLDDNPVDGLFAPRIQTEFGGEIVSIPLDADRGTRSPGNAWTGPPGSGRRSPSATEGSGRPATGEGCRRSTLPASFRCRTT